MNNNIKRFLALVLSLVLVFSLATCGNEKTGSDDTTESQTEDTTDDQASGISFTPGTYAGEAQGFGGIIKLEVEVDETSILAVNILENAETEGIGSIAIEQIPEKIVSGQTLNVDTISGCTMSSEAILDASEAALLQSGVDINLLKNVSSDAAQTAENKTFDTDLVIIGAGGAGMTAAIRARELGLEVLVVEKMPMVGGATSMSSSSALTVNTRLQAEQGIEDSKELAMKDLMIVGENENDPVPLGLLAEYSGAAVDWLSDEMGVKFNEDLGSASAEYSVPRARSAVAGSGAGLTQELRVKMEDMGATLLLETEAYELTDSDGVVNGVLARKADGSEYTINADAVLLATGGYCFADEYIDDALKSLPCSGSIANTADGLKMALQYDAKLQNMDYVAVAGHGIRKGDSAQHTKPGCIVTYRTTGTILVNQDGERFVNETDRDAVVVEKMMEEERSFMVMDADAFKIYTDNSLERGYYSQEELTEWLENNGTGVTVIGHGDTLEEAAAKVDMDPATLLASVEKYNSAIDAGTDAEFGREVGDVKIGDGPYYLFEQSLRYSTTLGGLCINENLQVLTEADAPIVGLYASGEVIGGVFGKNFPPSTGVGWALTSGMLASDNIYENISA